MTNLSVGTTLKVIAIDQAKVVGVDCRMRTIRQHTARSCLSLFP